MNKKTKIIFDNSTRDFVLEAFSKTIDDEGFIVEKCDPSVRVQTPEGEELKKEQLAVITKGSQKFITGDLTSLMKLSRGEI
jgi:hypothetical protein